MLIKYAVKEMLQGWRALYDLWKDLGSTLSTHLMAHNIL